MIWMQRLRSQSHSNYKRYMTEQLTVPRLRLKIRAPYKSLQSEVAKLERIQQASGILRRTSRFVILTRRLEVQLAEMDKAEAAESKTETTPKKAVNGDSSNSLFSQTLENEDEKERTIAKAALTIAELSQSYSLAQRFPYVTLISLP